MSNLKELPMDVTTHIRNFRNFLNASWPFLDELMINHDWDTDGEFIDEWLQVNWEFLVEREILHGEGFITQFSVTHLSGRITRREIRPNYTIFTKIDNEIEDIKKRKVPIDKDLRLYSFSTTKNGRYGLYPPFELAELIIDSTKERFTIPFEDLKFYLKII